MIEQCIATLQVLKIDFYFLCIYTCLHVSLNSRCLSGVHGGQNSVLDPLEQDLHLGAAILVWELNLFTYWILFRLYSISISCV